MLDEEVPDVRPGFTATADIVTATRKSAVAVPIPAVAVRELIYDANGQIVREPRTDKKRAPAPDPTAPPAELKPGQTRKETEGVFVLKEGRAEFVPIKVGIAGDRYFEVVRGSRTATRSSPGRTTRCAAWWTAIRSRSTRSHAANGSRRRRSSLTTPVQR